MSDRIVVEQKDGFLLATLNRPEARNAIDLALIEALHELCSEVETRPQMLAFQGSGEYFAAGADIGQLRERGPVEALTGINSRAFDRIARLPFPSVAVVNGPALGGGAELAYACDLRIATPAARFGNPEPNLGIIAGAGASWRLRDLIGLGLAADVLLFGRVLDAQEAMKHGLVTHVVEPDMVDELLKNLAAAVNAASPLALRISKLALYAPRDAHPAIDDVAQAALFQTAEKYERMDHFLSRRRSK